MATKSIKQTGEDQAADEVAKAPSVELALEPAQQPSVEDDAMVSSTVQAAFMITLEDYIRKLSLRDKRIELINGFYYTEKQAGHIKDYESNFQARFIAFTQLVIED